MRALTIRRVAYLSVTEAHGVTLGGSTCVYTGHEPRLSALSQVDDRSRGVELDLIWLTPSASIRDAMSFLRCGSWMNAGFTRPAIAA
jgi:hypothetical protein